MSSNVSEARHRNMAAIRAKNTAPEMTVRRALHAGGFRFRIHSKSLVGVPGIVLPKHHVTIFVNGCFWHCHECSRFRWPQTRPDFWREKLHNNRARDLKVNRALWDGGWRIATIWECSLINENRREMALAMLRDWIPQGGLALVLDESIGLSD